MRQLTRSEIGPWEIITALVIFFLLMLIPASGQTTTVTATAVDQSSQAWANGTWNLQFTPNPNQPTNNINWNGNPFPTSEWVNSGSLNSSGAFSQAGIQSNNFITPTGSTYTLTICPNATSPCTVLRGLLVTGSTIDFSSAFTAASPAPIVKPLPLARAYNDSEVSINPSLVGYFYQNVTTNQPRYWGQDQVWHNFIVGVGSLTAGNFNPLFTTSLGSDPANPDLTFNAETAAANKVFGNCTTGTAVPNFCSLTAAQIPALPYLPSSTTLFYQTVESAGTAETQRPVLDFGTDFVVADVASPPRTTVAPINVGTAGTYTCPSQIVTDIKGRTTSVTSRTCPSTTFMVLTAEAVGCTTPSGGPTGLGCTQTLTWSGTFPDTNYVATCSGGSPFTSGSSAEPNAVDLIGWGTKTTTTINTETVSKGSDGSASFGTIDCIGVHN